MRRLSADSIAPEGEVADLAIGRLDGPARPGDARAARPSPARPGPEHQDSLGVRVRLGHRDDGQDVAHLVGGHGPVVAERVTPRTWHRPSWASEHFLADAERVDRHDGHFPLEGVGQLGGRNAVAEQPGLTVRVRPEQHRAVELGPANADHGDLVVLADPAHQIFADRDAAALLGLADFFGLDGVRLGQVAGDHVPARADDLAEFAGSSANFFRVAASRSDTAS
jgi:hypothetical protein